MCRGHGAPTRDDEDLDNPSDTENIDEMLEELKPPNALVGDETVGEIKEDRGLPRAHDDDDRHQGQRSRTGSLPLTSDRSASALEEHRSHNSPHWRDHHQSSRDDDNQRRGSQNELFSRDVDTTQDDMLDISAEQPQGSRQNRPQSVYSYSSGRERAEPLEAPRRRAPAEEPRHRALAEGRQCE
jgi:hypothetical protein